MSEGGGCCGVGLDGPYHRQFKVWVLQVQGCVVVSSEVVETTMHLGLWLVITVSTTHTIIIFSNFVLLKTIKKKYIMI